MFRLLISMLLVLGSTAALAAADDDWELRRDRDGIQVYTRSVEGSPYDAVRSVTVVQDVPLSAMVALLEDAPACADWADRCAESYVVERLAKTESLVYTLNDMPFPVKDRDVVAHVIWHQDPVSKTVTMQSQATEGEMDQISGRVRLTQAQVQWQFRPLPSGAVEVSNQAHIDPGSALPGWVTNMLLVDTPFETMRAFVAEVQKPAYQSATVDFITEP